MDTNGLVPYYMSTRVPYIKIHNADYYMPYNTDIIYGIQLRVDSAGDPRASGIEVAHPRYANDMMRSKCTQPHCILSVK